MRSKAAMGARSPVGGGRGEGFCLRYAIGCGLRERRTAGGGAR